MHGLLLYCYLIVLTHENQEFMLRKTLEMFNISCYICLDLQTLLIDYCIHFNHSEILKRTECIGTRHGPNRLFVLLYSPGSTF